MQRFIRCYCTSRQSYYDILGLSKTATAAEIKKAFYTLSKKYHPDITGSNEAATKKFVAIKEAYDILKDTEKRQAYDSQMSGGFSPFSNSNQGYQQSNPFQSGFQDAGNPFQNTTQFEQRWRNGRWEYTYVKRGPGQQTFTQEDFERIWREFQRKTQDPRHAAYDKMFRERREKVWDDFTTARAEAWRKRAEEHVKKYPSDNMSMNPSHYINWDKFNRWIIVYVIIFFIIGFIQTIMQGEKEAKEKERPKSAKEKLEEMINRPPPPPSSDSSWYSDSPREGPRNY